MRILFFTLILFCAGCKSKQHVLEVKRMEAASIARDTRYDIDFDIIQDIFDPSTGDSTGEVGKRVRTKGRMAVIGKDSCTQSTAAVERTTSTVEKISHSAAILDRLELVFTVFLVLFCLVIVVFLVRKV